MKCFQIKKHFEFYIDNGEINNSSSFSVVGRVLMCVYRGLICQICHSWKNHNNTFTSLTLLGCLFKMRFMAMTIQLLAILGDN